ncbi:MAG TPA: GNAT family N-acetyltransferase [Candidatus Thermoplasmatota archaeon]|nr:GNAT family N-acetyltransferase [Candidatus Thermoplasmatota archaeon]
MTPAEARIRPGTPADMEWVRTRKVAVYAEEFGYGPVFGTYVAQTIPPFLHGLDPAKDRTWVAEDAQGIAGFIAIHHDAERPGWAKLRWFLVERRARGTGLGRRLFDASLAFARQAGYQGVHLHTVSDLVEARKMYERAGFRLVEESKEPCPWAPWAHEQEWELRLSG